MTKAANWRLDHGNRKRSALGAHRGARHGPPTAVLVFGGDHRRLLPAVMPVRARANPRTSRCTTRSKAPRRPASGPASAASRTGARSDAENAAPGRQGLPADRAERGSTVARRTGRGGRPAARLFPPRVQGGDRRDAQGLCRRASRGARPRAAWRTAGQRDRGDLRRRLQFERPLLREVRPRCSA